MKVILNSTLQSGQIVNKVGKYLYNHIDSSYKFKKSPNTYDVYFIVNYVENTTDEYKEMHLILSVSTYSDKIRIFINEITPEERTIGFMTTKFELFDDMNTAYGKIMNTVLKQLYKTYPNYSFEV